MNNHTAKGVSMENHHEAQNLGGSVAPAANNLGTHMPAANNLGTHMPPVLDVFNPNGTSPFTLICEHANRKIPDHYNNLGLAPADLDKHIAYDLGVFDMSKLLARKLDAPLFYANYSRLLVDLNRPTSSAELIPAINDDIPIPGNQNLSAQQRETRLDDYYHSFHDGLEAKLSAAQYNKSVIVGCHSFTRVHSTGARPWHAAVLSVEETNAQANLALKLMECLAHEAKALGAIGGSVLGYNLPYAAERSQSYTVFRHGTDANRKSVAFEIRQDLLEHESDQNLWAEALSTSLIAALKEMEDGHGR